MTRRKLIRNAASLSLAALAAPRLPQALAMQVGGGRLKQSVSLWTYQKWFDLDALCKEAVRIGLKGIDLVTPDQYATVKKYGFI